MELDDALAHATALEEILTLFWRQVAGQPGTRARGFPIPSRLRELDERLSRILSQSRNIHNTFSSQDRVLPDDLLYLILEQACVVEAKPLPSPWKHTSVFDGYSMFSTSMARMLSGVCRRWRSLLLSNPIVWSDVRVTIRRPENLSWLDVCLTRSASSSAGCMIQIDQPYGFSQGPDAIGVISRHPSNIRCLHVNPRNRDDYEFLTLNLENLERLHIKGGTFSRRPIPPAPRFPRLSAVILQRLPTVPHDTFVNLTDLTLQNIISPITNLVDMLQANQALENIRFNDTLVEADPHGRLVSLPDLKLLCISSSSPIAILRILSPLSTPSRVIIHDDTTSLAPSEIRILFNPFLIFGPNDSVRAASISFPPGETSITFHTSNDAILQIIIQAAPMVAGGGHPAEFYSLLLDVSRWGPFPSLRSMHLHIDPTATGPIHGATIHSLLSAAPRMIHLSFSGSTLFRHISYALKSSHASGVICPELEFLGGTLRPDDGVVDGLRLLSDAVKRGPATIRKIVLGVPGSKEEIAAILEEAGPLIQEIKSHGADELLFTPITVWDYSSELCSF